MMAVKFAKGVSGNPAGRPKGARNRRTLALEKIARDASGDVLRATIDAAVAGDMTAARLILDRAYPVRKDAPIGIDLPAIDDAGDIVQAGEAILAAVAGGSITPSEGDAVMALLERHRRLIETADLAEQVETIKAEVDALKTARARA